MYHKADFNKHDLIKWVFNKTNPFIDQDIDWIIKNDMDYIMIDFIGDYIDDKPVFDQTLWSKPILYVYFDVDYNDKEAYACLIYDNNFEFQEMIIKSSEEKTLLKVYRNETN